jgi:hypothetical protein
MSAWTYRRYRQGRPKDRSTLSSNPMMEGPTCRFRREARARERYRHGLKALDPDRPIREADIAERNWHVRFVPQADIANIACGQRVAVTTNCGASAR